MHHDSEGLVRALSARDASLVTVGAVLGTGIFLTTGDIARVLPHAGLILLVWALGGVLSLSGALTYAELGAMYPRAGGQYHYLKEAYGTLWGFLFGWACFFVIMTGGLAALAAGFGEYLGAFVPFFSTDNVLLVVPAGPWRLALDGGQLAGALAIAVLSAVNYYGLKEAARVQNAVTVLKLGSIALLAAAGLAAPTDAPAPALLAPLPDGGAGLMSALGVAMIAVLWSFDGWYGATTLAGEMRHPERDLPRGLLYGTLAITGLYLLVNLAYVRALSVPEMAASSRIGEDAAAALFGPAGARVVAAAVVLSILGCLAATVLYPPRIYLAMARDGVFFRSLARVHPRHHTPGACIVAQGVWAVLLTFSGTFEELYTYVVFAMFCFHAATGLAVFVLRRTRPDHPRPYRVRGYPWVPILFIATALAFVLNTLVGRPVESGLGLGIVALGLPAYWWWRRSTAPPEGPTRPSSPRRPAGSGR